MDRLEMAPQTAVLDVPDEQLKPADHPHRCVVFDLGYGAVEVKWSDTYGYYRYFYAYEYSNSGTRKSEKVLLREQLGRSTDEVKANLLTRLDDGAFTNGYRANKGAGDHRGRAGARLMLAYVRHATHRLPLDEELSQREDVDAKAVLHIGGYSN